MINLIFIAKKVKLAINSEVAHIQEMDASVFLYGGLWSSKSHIFRNNESYKMVLITPSTKGSSQSWCGVFIGVWCCISTGIP